MTSSTTHARHVIHRDPDLASFEVVNPSTEGRYWPSWTRTWTSRPVGRTVDGYLLCGLLADPRTEAAMRASPSRGDLFRTVMEHVVAAPHISLVVHPATWPQIEAAQRAAQSQAMNEAIHRSPLSRRVVDRFKAVLRSLVTLVRPSAACAAHRVDLAPPPAAKATAAAPATCDLLVDDVGALQDDLRKCAQEIQRPGRWSGLGGEIAVHAITSLGRWPQGRPLHIENRATGELLARLGDSAWAGAPVRVSLDCQREHYSPIVNGRIGQVPADGDCFFASVLQAMTPTERRALLMAPSTEGLTSKAAQARLRQFVADGVRRMARHPDTAPESVVNAWVAHRT